MCGRVDFSWEVDDPAVHRLQEIMTGRFAAQPLPRGEVFPGSRFPVLTHGDTRADIQLLRWGIALENKRLIINARSETAAQKVLFRDDLANRRCVLLTTGFFEWAHDASKQKYLFRLPDSAVVYLAGIYNPNGEFVVLTQAANASMAPIHNRMPVILRQNRVRAYLRSQDAAVSLFSCEGPPLTAVVA